jgi:hypothetical protein
MPPDFRASSLLPHYSLIGLPRLEGNLANAAKIKERGMDTAGKETAQPKTRLTNTHFVKISLSHAPQTRPRQPTKQATKSNPAKTTWTPVHLYAHFCLVHAKQKSKPATSLPPTRSPPPTKACATTTKSTHMPPAIAKKTPSALTKRNVIANTAPPPSEPPSYQKSLDFIASLPFVKWTFPVLK